MPLLLTLASETTFYTHGFVAMLIIAVLFTLIGMLVGWTLWRHGSLQADDIEMANETLRQREIALAKSKNTLNELIAQIPDDQSK